MSTESSASSASAASFTIEQPEMVRKMSDRLVRKESSTDLSEPEEEVR
jgi:hypothetical protein